MPCDGLVLPCHRANHRLGEDLFAQVLVRPVAERLVSVRLTVLRHRTLSKVGLDVWRHGARHCGGRSGHCDGVVVEGGRGIERVFENLRNVRQELANAGSERARP